MEEELKGLLGFCPLTISVIRSRYFLNWLCSAVVPKIVFPAAACACWSDCYCKCLISAGSWFETCASLRTALLISAPKHTPGHIIVINTITEAQPDILAARDLLARKHVKSCRMLLFILPNGGRLTVMNSPTGCSFLMHKQLAISFNLFTLN